MKRQIFSAGDNGESEGEMPIIESPVRKRQRPGERGALQERVAGLRAICTRVREQTADAEDLSEMLRLTLGGMVGGPGSAWRALAPEATGPDASCMLLVRAYDVLWKELSYRQNKPALDAVAEYASDWPPTFNDVVRTYGAVDPESAPPHLNILEEHVPTRSFHWVIGDLVRGLNAAVERRELTRQAGARAIDGFIEPFATGESAWASIVDPQSLLRLPGCDPNTVYYIVTMRGQNDHRAALFVLGPGYDMARLCALVGLAPHEPATLAEPLLLDVAPDIDEEDVEPALSSALLPYADVVSLFLASLVAPTDVERFPEEEQEYADAIAETEALLDPLPAGAREVEAVMVPLGSEFALPEVVRLFIDETYADPEGDWYEYAMRGARLDECRLRLTLSLFKAQIDARAIAYDARQRRRNEPATLVDLAARAYNGPLRAGMAPDEVLDRAAAFAWERTCAGEPLASGRFPYAQRLLDVARLWGVKPDLIDGLWPELLCESLAPIAATREPFRLRTTPAGPQDSEDGTMVLE
ncbi:hypothetical protein pmac_cds_114 [Pandoravirus macleodensis]|uniref:Uncharacterized protein n=1 Tax=Pandoravirus macleodensis TaxID=2107707 RepID=A0A2U7UEH1_9VIRU|nr:hypothetical protein pmac_cds_114 [Pandoravirus macleodensis]AVK76802.1 hypothetical protein pmac_cds_114 [Pandoravirus macleodensis]